MSAEKEGYVEVTAKVPKLLMKVLEDQDYFGWTREQFFTVAVRRGVSCEIAELDVNEMKELELKFPGVDDATVVDLDEKRKGHKITIPTEDYELLEKLAKEVLGLTVEQAIEYTMLHGMKKLDPEWFKANERIKEYADPKVLELLNERG